jgi:hypothetical protein
VSGIEPYNLFLKDRLVSFSECWAVGERTALENEDIESLERIKDAIGKIAFMSPEARLGSYRNLMLVPAVNNAINCYYCPIASHNENVAFSYWPRSSKYVFGSNLAFSSSFCINSYYSLNLCRALEVDGSGNCSDIYFSHHCENVRDAMFCFNAKNLKSAIGNMPLLLERYKEIKSSLLAQITEELERNKDMPWDIFNMGAMKDELA